MIVNTDSADKDRWPWFFSTLLDGGSPRNNY